MGLSNSEEEAVSPFDDVAFGSADSELSPP